MEENESVNNRNLHLDDLAKLELKYKNVGTKYVRAKPFLSHPQDSGYKRWLENDIGSVRELLRE